ncbi:uncharacterized protein LOC141653625 isoform X2 [Silene latifolia]|uniref:uncharacterized protein LOC141653625 isoform X2 n=1 Tax=Silene latifolia TaxID=37657 RepID=UPI003D76CCCE
MNNRMKGYESKIGRYKRDLFSRLKGQAHEILEIRIGTDPNLKYYASDDGVHVIGVDPNRKMEKYTRKEVGEVGLANFNFVHVVIPEPNCSRYGLAVGTHFAWLVRLLMIVCYPIAYPIGKVFLRRNYACCFNQEENRYYQVCSTT